MWDLKIIDVSKPLYIAIADALEKDIRNGVLQAGDLLPTHRELAKKVGVTISTVTRAYGEATRRNLIMAIVGKGTFVASDATVQPWLVDTVHKKPLIEMGLVHPLYAKNSHLEEVIRAVLQHERLHNYIMHSSPQGVPRHKEIGAEWVKKMGVPTAKSCIAITAGTQHALYCLFSGLFEPGDRIAVDCLTYPGVKVAARRCGIRLEAVEMDSCGMIPASLEALCNRLPVKGIYASGNIQNPTNFNMTDDRRQAIARIIASRGLLLVEDDVYGFLARQPKPLTALVPQHGIYIGGLSKAFYAGLRVAFVSFPPELAGKIAQSMVDSIWMTSPICAEIACEAIESGMVDKVINIKKRELAKRAELFREKMQGYSYNMSEIGMFAWLRLPEHWTSSEFEQAAKQNGVNVIGAEHFIIGHVPPPDYVRISLSATSSKKIFSQGLDILHRVLEQGGG